MSLPHIDTVRDREYSIRTRCCHHPPSGDGRCPNNATLHLVSPTGMAVMRSCAECAERCLAEYAEHAELLGGAWYSVPMKLEQGEVAL